jgi:trimeric autotransporter adhesin
MSSRLLLLPAALAAAMCALSAAPAHAARFTYHGELLDGAAPADGAYDLRLRAFAQPGAQAALGEATELPGVRVVEGRFSVELDLPEDADGTTWIEVAVKPSGPGTEYAVLGTPQPVTKANSTCPGAWALDGNTGVPAGSFLGLADPIATTPLDLRARNARVARFIPTTDDSAFGDAPTVVLGSPLNAANGIGAAVAGGGATRLGGAPCSGCGNVAHGNFSFVGGGLSHTASATFASVAGGSENTASGSAAHVGGGTFNRAGGADAFVGAGASNEAMGPRSVIGGGQDNAATTNDTVVAGGSGNVADATHAVVGGGQGNAVTGEHGVVGGGQGNTASAQFATVAGGFQNEASNLTAAVGGGFQNLARGPYAAIAGGQGNVAGGAHAFAAGSGNCAGGDASVALGQGARVRHPSFIAIAACSGASSGDGDGDEGAFVYSDAAVPAFSSTAPGQFNVRARGGVGINTAPPVGSVELTIQTDTDDGDFSNLWMKQKANANGILMTAGNGPGSNNAGFYIDHYNGAAQARRLELAPDGSVTIRSNITQAASGVRMAAGDGSWSSLSDRRLKTAIAPVDAGAILERLLATPIATWSYRAQAGVRHIGPMAQDFAASFAVGENDTTISTVDADGVALAAIQGLDAKLERENAQLRHALDALTARLARLESAREH